MKKLSRIVQTKIGGKYYRVLSDNKLKTTVFIDVIFVEFISF